MTKQSLRTKFIIIMGLLVTVPIVLLTAISLFNTVNEGKKSANEVNEAQAGLVRESIGIIRSKNLESLKALATSPVVIEYLDGTSIDSKDEEALLKNILTVNRNLDEGRSTGNSIAIADATGMQRLRTSGKNVDVSERDYFKVPMSGASEYSSDLIISKSTGTAIITFSVPVYDKMGQNIIGIVQRNYDVSELQEMLASEVTQDRQEIVIVDRTGTVIAHSARSVNVEDPEMQDQNEFYTDSRGDKTSGNYVAPFMGDTWIISWEKIPGCDWIVASCRVQEVAIANVYITAAAQLVIGVIMIVISIIIAIFVANSITKPLGAVNVSLAAM
ncbi:MAG: cache domain-containing protein, partial [Lachnospiraceae bacterium]|nr:cache domain-containing protein [Lachnospiraceae bacterium]